jgi:hypothetical protein
MKEALKNGDGQQAHAILTKMLNRGEHPLMIAGLLKDWFTRLCMVLDVGDLDDSAKKKIKTILKWKKKERKKKKKDGEAEETQEEAGEAVELLDIENGESVVWFSKPEGLYYSCKEVAGRPADWPWPKRALLKLFYLELAVRQAKPTEYRVLMHRYLEDLLGETS